MTAKPLIAVILGLLMLLASHARAQTTTDAVTAANGAFYRAQAEYSSAVQTYGSNSPQARTAQAKMVSAANELSAASRATPSSGTSTIVASAGLAASSTTHQLCVTCAVFNVFDTYFVDYAKRAFVIIGNGVTILAFSFALAFGLLRFALYRLAPQFGREAPPPVDLTQLLIFLGGVAALRYADSIIWRIYDAGMEWGASAAITLIEAGNDGGGNLIPPGATSQVAKIVGSAEGVLWGFIEFAWKTVTGPTLWEWFSSDQSLAGAIIFGLLVAAVYGGLLLYFAYIILQAYIFFVLPIPFGSLIVAAACFKATRNVTFEAGRLIAHAFFTFIAAGISMGFTARMLALSKNVVACYTASTRSNACAAPVGKLAAAMGVPTDALVQTFSSFEMFMVLVVIGACCWIVHFLTLHVAAKLVGAQSMGGPLAMFAAATAGTIVVGARAAYQNTKSAINRGLDIGRSIPNKLGPKAHPLDME